MKRTYSAVGDSRPTKRTKYSRRRAAAAAAAAAAPVPYWARPGAEWKYSDVTISQNMTTTGFQVLLNGLHAGNTAVTRVGMKVSIRSVEVRGYVYATPGSGVDQTHRVLLIQDKQANAAAPTLLSSYLAPANINGLRNLANRKRFKNLTDNTWDLNATAEPGTFKSFHFYLKFKRPLIVEFNGADNGDEQDIVSNALWLVGLGSEGVGASAGSIQAQARIRYTDV